MILSSIITICQSEIIYGSLQQKYPLKNYLHPLPQIERMQMIGLYCREALTLKIFPKGLRTVRTRSASSKSLNKEGKLERIKKFTPFKQIYFATKTLTSASIIEGIFF